ncbi:Glutathione synthase/RimK-type ligase, ATP-grasp superfamily [Halomicrobium zhouii]|uniref:Glutathione synthase/RimK-type ligase, ATP-grasp superfamily n=1 Tax=Halomicrobium zhouii TaxID=767519 RepID=A0A1I6KQ17_9EURY|nr:ATP-grasp domain-containing protein [Halomicrobium zhouii]SFR93294.1 Glutathione synthase/RimK-type ligase, ATP-grasp superfamily [Halomicrobium zhouii]
MVVAILGTRDDPQVQSVGAALDDRGVEWELWNSGDWPGDHPVSLSVAAGPADAGSGSESATGTSGTWAVVGEMVDPDRVTAVYLRRIGLDPRGPAFEDDLAERPYSLVNQVREYRGLVTSVLTHLESRGVPVVNPVAAQSVHGLKPYQLAAFEDAEIPVPDTLATNDPDAARAFVERVGDAVYKPVGGGGHARSITPADLDSDHLDRLANAPVQFQERVAGENYRLFVVGGDVVATGHIRSEELDYRLGEHEVDAAIVPSTVEDAAVRAADVLDLHFAGVDVIADGEGEFAVLEANPSPMFAAFDERAGTDVAGHLAAFLDR